MVTKIPMGYLLSEGWQTFKGSEFGGFVTALL